MFQMIVHKFWSLKCYSVNFFSAIINGIKILTVAASQKNFTCVHGVRLHSSGLQLFVLLMKLFSNRVVLQLEADLPSQAAVHACLVRVPSMMLSMVEREMLWRGS